MEEQPYIEIGNHKYPISIPISPQFTMDESSPEREAWRLWRKLNSVGMSVQAELTEPVQSMFQEYLSDGRCEITISTAIPPHITTWSRYYRRRPRNIRIQRVLAKRKAMDLSQDGKCVDLRTRRASLALRQAEERWYRNMSARRPLASDYERIPPRVRRKRQRHIRGLIRAMRGMYDEHLCDLAFPDFAKEMIQAFGIPASIVGVIPSEE